MKLFRHIILVMAVIVFVSVLFGIEPVEQNAYAGSLAEINSVTCSPSELPATGGTVTVTVEISVKTCLNELWVTMPDRWSYNTGSYAGSTTITKSYSCSITPDRLDETLYVSMYAIDCNGTASQEGGKGFVVNTQSDTAPDSQDSSSNKTDYFKTTQTVSPDKNTYYVGDTVNVHSVFKSSASTTANGLTVYYYYSREGDNKVTDISNNDLGNVSSKGSVEDNFEYTFTENDIGQFKLGSVIKYSVESEACEQWNKQMEFTVIDKSGSTNSTDSSQSNIGTSSQSSNNASQDSLFSSENIQYSIDSFFEDKETILLTVVIVAGVVFVIFIILIVMLIVKKSKS